MISRVCNMCGKEFDDYEKQENLGFHQKIGYGSIFDGMEVNFDLCCPCFDKLMKEYIIPNYKINTIKSVDDEIDYESYKAELASILR